MPSRLFNSAIVVLTATFLTACQTTSTTSKTFSVYAPMVGKEITVPLDLDVPEGLGPFPAVVLAHGCSGLNNGSPYNWRKVFRQAGFATVIVDSFGPRGWSNVCTDQPLASPPAQADRAAELIGAANQLMNDPRIDPRRISVMGFSHGAGSALFVSNRAPGPFTKAIANYPWCGRDENSELHITKTPFIIPTLIVAGGKDDYCPAQFCQTLYNKRKPTSPNLNLVILKDAPHSFDSGSRFLTRIGCGGVEGKCGVSVSSGHDEPSFRQAQKIVLDFLSD